MSARNAAYWLAALALPLIGLGAGWAVTHTQAQQGTDWDVPIRGYDPRDLLRGHYITFRYDWPGLKPDDSFNGPEALCIDGTAPSITGVSELNPGIRQRCAVIARASDSDRRGGGLGNGIFYVPQTAAQGYETKLRDTTLKGIMRVRIRDDGLVRPVSLGFRRKTAAEITTEATEAQAARDSSTSPPPPVVTPPQTRTDSPPARVR